MKERKVPLEVATNAFIRKAHAFKNNQPSGKDGAKNSFSLKALRGQAYNTVLRELKGKLANAEDRAAANRAARARVAVVCGATVELIEGASTPPRRGDAPSARPEAVLWAVLPSRT